MNKIPKIEELLLNEYNRALDLRNLNKSRIMNPELNWDEMKYTNKLEKSSARNLSYKIDNIYF